MIKSEVKVKMEVDHLDEDESPATIKSSAKSLISEATFEDRSSSLSPAPKKLPIKVFVGNLSSIVTPKELRELFEIHGRVSDVDVMEGFAFVFMPDAAEAFKAIEALHDTTLGGKSIVVEKKSKKHLPLSVVKRAIRGIAGCRSDRPIELFVAQVYDLSEERLRTTFEKFGDVVAVTKPRSKPDIAFIIMEFFFEARKALDSLNKKRLDNLGHTIFVELSMNNVTRSGRPLSSYLERGETIKLFVGNVAQEATSKDLGMLFEKYGPVYDAAVLKDKGYGFIHMLSTHSAEDAVHYLNKSHFMGQQLVVSYSKKRGMATEKSKRRLYGAKSLQPPSRLQAKITETFARWPTRKESLSEISDCETSLEDVEKKRKINVKAIALQRTIQNFLFAKQTKYDAKSSSSTSPSVDSCSSRKDRIRELKSFEQQWRRIEKRRSIPSDAFRSAKRKREDTNLWTWRRPRNADDESSSPSRQPDYAGESLSTKRTIDTTDPDIPTQALKRVAPSKAGVALTRHHPAAGFKAAARIAAKSLPPNLKVEV